MIHCNKSQSQLMNPACLYKITAKLTNPFWRTEIATFDSKTTLHLCLTMTSSHVFNTFVSVSKQSPILELLTYHDFLFWYIGGGLSYRCKQDSPSDRLFQHIFNPWFLHVGVTKNNFILTMLILSKRWLELRKMLTGHIVWFKTSFLKPKLCEMYRRLFGELIFWSWKKTRAEIHGYVLFRVGVHLPLELLNWLLLLHNK